MSELKPGVAGEDVAIDRSEKSGSIGLLLALAAGLVAAAVALALLPRHDAEPYVQILLGILAVIGVFSLFAGAIGLVRFTGKTSEHGLAPLIVETLGEGVLVTDAKGRIVFANRPYAMLLNAEDARDIRAVAKLFGGDPQASEPLFRLTQAARDGKACREEIRSSGLNGTTDVRWYRVAVKPIVAEGAAGKTPKKPLTAWYVADITADRAEQETSFQELQQVVTFLDHAPAGFFSADPRGRITYLNATLADWLGRDLARFEPGSIGLEDIVQGQGIALLADIGAVPGEAKTRIIDLDLRKKNGQSLPVRLFHRVPVSATGAFGDSRTLVLNRSPGEDISEALRAAEVRFARFFNNTPIAIAAIGKDGRIGRTNAPFLKLFGPPKASDGTSRAGLADYVTESGRPNLEAAIEAATRGVGDIAPVDGELTGDPPRKRFVRFYVSAVEDGQGEGEAAMVYALETTQQRELEQQFAQSQKMQAVGQLAGGIAHDFNNVLTAIIGFSDLLLGSHRPSDPSFQDIMNIKQNANRAASLVRQLLAFSRRQTLRPEIIQLGDTLTELRMLLSRLLGENVELKVVHGRDLWPIKADQSQLEQVIVNLAVNARDAMPSGGRLTISTRNFAAGDPLPCDTPGMPLADYVLIEVTDTGTGIPPAIMEKIFEPFFTTKPIGQGTGLGLSTVYGITKQTGGYIYCISEEGKGTTFAIFLPRQSEPASDKADQPRPEAPAQATDLTGSATILLVEDEEAVRAFASRALASRGYIVHEAGTGMEALAVMAETDGKIDLVVSDVVMPEMDGPSLLRELRKQQPDLKIIFVSGYAEDAFARNLPEGEAFHFLPKPFSLKQLATAVKEALEN
ncbi:MAG: response regulator [Ancalomicrobiaceae bacterium]|nr:response regulator [Ancalomicrobiaceae bacterium]